jgi:hypothetical protein
MGNHSEDVREFATNFSLILGGQKISHHLIIAQVSLRRKHSYNKNIYA